jgi:hypothetical protein
LKEAPVLKDLQDAQTSHASPSAVRDSQLIVLARILAQVVLPTPLGPVKRNAWARWLFKMAFFRVVVICDCPTTVEKCCGLYFLAETTKFSIRLQDKKRFSALEVPENSFYLIHCLTKFKLRTESLKHILTDEIHIGPRSGHHQFKSYFVWP